MTCLNDDALLQLTHDLLGSLCEELQLNCTPGQIVSEAPVAASIVKRATEALHAARRSIPSAATAVLMDGTGRKGRLN